jgi:hypothetical protein
MQSAAVPPPNAPDADSEAAAWATVLDQDALNRLRELDPDGKSGLLRRVLATYVQSLGRLLDQLAVARAASDLQGLRHVAHTLTVPVLMLTGPTGTTRPRSRRAYEAGATDFFVKSTQWSLLAGRLRYLLRASRTRIELERSKSKLARAQDLARMGSFDWQGAASGGLCCRPRRCACSAAAPSDPMSCARCCAWCRPERPARPDPHAAEVVAHNAVLPPTCRDLVRWQRPRIIHVEAEPEFNEQGHGVGYTGVVQDVTDRRVAEDRSATWPTSTR